MKVTMQDIAKELGIHSSTVSLALSESPKIAEETRRKIQTTAEAMGYRKNPYVSALMSARRNGRNPDDLPVIALIVAGETADEWKSRYNTSKFIEGCEDAAQNLGIRIDMFWVGEKGMSAERLNDILYSRGIRGTILVPAGAHREKLVHEWHDVALVSYGIYEVSLNIDSVRGDYYGNMESTLGILRENGFEKVGFAMETPYPYLNDNRWLSAYLMRRYAAPEKNRLEPWLDPEPSFDSFAKWFEQAQPDAIICVRPQRVLEWLDRMGLKVPGDISLVTVGTAVMDGEYSGIVENARACGKLALEMLFERIHHNQFGLVGSPHHITVSGNWNAGSTARYRV
ncbi:HTH-type transcriptional repressor CytR [Pontiella desulfatans]|uniref:HTH-type transcriptional repressor CytR n=1 Tax=Pontiella desulfatans TaxID=2750659 RepID=A0A6C2U9F6_PONDE|nr:LacI family DNA-binding transcriptional regulator [Pontiella desulfatans]VGO16680.1 HTH-type transcriptional repressor CytR [Pontiella desulfatans]